MKESVGHGKSLAYWLLGIVAALLLFLFVIEPAKKQDATAPMTTLIPVQEDPKHAVARDFVLGKLLAPAEAEFSSASSDYHLTNLGADRYQVSSHVTVRFPSGGTKFAWFTVTMRSLGSGRYVLDGKGVELFEEGSKQSRQE